MKKQLFLLFVITSLCGFSQNSFKKGYFINNSNEKIDCLISEQKSKNNPTELEYKLSDKSPSEKLTIESVKEFGINNASKYIRQNVAIDKSSNTTNSLNYDRNPSYTNELLFLKVLIEGKANLYAFESNVFRRFFYSTENSSIKQLIFKRYINSKGEIKTNDDFKRQLWNGLKCDNISDSYTKNLTYKKTQLINFFIKYNECVNSGFIKFENKETQDLFNLTLRPGLNSSSLITHYNSKDYYDVDFGRKLGFRLGMEVEFIIKSPNRNNWSILCEPTYQYYKSKIEVQRTSRQYITEVDYKSIELPLGVRHYFFIDDNFKIFFDGAVLFDFAMNSKIKSNFEGAFELKSGNNFAFGIGTKFINKYSFELRYMTSRNTLFSYIARDSDYKTISAIFGYTIF